MDLKLNALFEVVLVFILLTGAYRFFASFPSGKWIEYVCVAVLFVILVSFALAGKDFSRYGISPINTDGELKAALVFTASMFFLMLGGFWVAFVLVLLAITGRDFSRYGITMRGLGSDLKIVAICIIPVMAVDCSALFFNIGDIRGTLFFSFLIVILPFVLLRLLKNVPYQEDTITLPARYLVPVIVAGSISSLIFILGNTEGYHSGGPADFVPLAINALVFGFVLQAIPQEILFRGYIQTRLNEAFGRPYTLFGIRWGAGLAIASLLFGLLHVINPFNPFKGEYNLNFFWGIWTFFFGLVYGFLREKTGNITAPTIVHGIENSFSYITWFG
jgi:membrane protease YdiL (CAAX protease family)